MIISRRVYRLTRLGQLSFHEGTANTNKIEIIVCLYMCILMGKRLALF